MIYPILKMSEIKKDPNCLLGWDKYPYAAITRYGSTVAYVVSPDRMEELLNAERSLKAFKGGLQCGQTISIDRKLGLDIED